MTECLPDTFERQFSVFNNLKYQRQEREIYRTLVDRSCPSLLQCLHAEFVLRNRQGWNRE
jgi:hypothetical protein